MANGMKLTLPEWRRVRNHSQQYMADLLDIHINTYRAWEEKPSDIKLCFAVRIAEILGVTMDEIIFLP